MNLNTNFPYPVVFRGSNTNHQTPDNIESASPDNIESAIDNIESATYNIESATDNINLQEQDNDEEIDLR